MALRIYFEGAFQVVDVYLNGRHLGEDRGTYKRSNFDATGAAMAGDDALAVKMSSAACADYWRATRGWGRDTAEARRHLILDREPCNDGVPHGDVDC